MFGLREVRVDKREMKVKRNPIFFVSGVEMG
jgi:hypothetical protein